MPRSDSADGSGEWAGSRSDLLAVKNTAAPMLSTITKTAVRDRRFVAIERFYG